MINLDFSVLVAAACFGFGAAHAAETSHSGMLDCKGVLNGEPVRWQIRFDDTQPLAVVNEKKSPVNFTASHMHIQLASDGPTLFIGRISGRLIVSAPDGTRLGAGICTPGNMLET